MGFHLIVFYMNRRLCRTYDNKKILRKLPQGFLGRVLRRYFSPCGGLAELRKTSARPPQEVLRSSLDVLRRSCGGLVEVLRRSCGGLAEFFQNLAEFFRGLAEVLRRSLRRSCGGLAEVLRRSCGGPCGGLAEVLWRSCGGPLCIIFLKNQLQPSFLPSFYSSHSS